MVITWKIKENLENIFHERKNKMKKTNLEIDKILQLLGDYWKNGETANLRLGQLISTLCGKDVDVFNIDDEEIIDAIQSKYIDVKKYKIDCGGNDILIAPNYENYTQKKEFPIFLELQNNTSSSVEFSISQAKKIVLALSEIVDYVEEQKRKQNQPW